MLPEQTYHNRLSVPKCRPKCPCQEELISVQIVLIMGSKHGPRTMCEGLGRKRICDHFLIVKHSSFRPT